MILKLKKFRSTPPCAHRAGFTLIELMLVIAIMVVIAALAAPSIQRSFSRQGLQKGADRVRVAMGQARVKAIRNGEEYAVFYTPTGSWFNVAPYSKFSQQADLASRRQRIFDEGNHSNFEEDLLPKGVKFSGGRTDVNSRAAAVLNSSDANGNAISMILFYPDGTSQDAQLILENEKQFFIQLDLRGLTGMARTVRVEDPSSQR